MRNPEVIGLAPRNYVSLYADTWLQVGPETYGELSGGSDPPVRLPHRPHRRGQVGLKLNIPGEGESGVDGSTPGRHTEALGKESYRLPSFLCVILLCRYWILMRNAVTCKVGSWTGESFKVRHAQATLVAFRPCPPRPRPRQLARPTKSICCHRRPRYQSKGGRSQQDRNVATSSSSTSCNHQFLCCR